MSESSSFLLPHVEQNTISISLAPGIEFIAAQPRQGKPGVPAVLDVVDNFRCCNGIKTITSGMKTTRCVVCDFP